MKTIVKIALAAVIPSFFAVTSAMAANQITIDTGSQPSISPAERSKIESVVHDYLVQKPEVLLEAMQVLQKKQYEQAEQSVKKTQQDAPQFTGSLFHQNNDPIAGNPNGKVTVVEFFDYQCPHCVQMAPVMSAVIKSNPNLRVVFKEWPIRGPLSEFASRAALAANMQGKYVEFSHALLSSNQPLTQDSIFAIAKTIGLNVDKLKSDMNNAAVSDQLKNNFKLAQDLKLFGTPAFFIGLTDGKSTNINYVPGQVDQNQLQGLIDKAGK